MVIWMTEEVRLLFQQYLHRMGYGGIPLTSHIFDELLNLYLGGEGGRMVETEFAPVWEWKSKIAEKLLEPFKTFEPL